MSLLETVESELEEFQLDLTLPQKAALTRYGEELIHWNKKINLTGLRGAEMVRRLIVEPVWIGLQLKMSGVLADIGSGNGSPAIPLLIVSGFSRVHLVEARIRRAAFLRHLIVVLGRPEPKVHHSRFEDVALSLGPVDWVTLQGVALTAEMIEAIRHIKSKTTTVVWITSNRAAAPVEPTARLRVPITGTEVLLFDLDQS